MDSTLTGVLIGSGLSLFGTILSQILLSKKEQKQWENQQATEKENWKRTEQKKEKEYLREIYQNSLRSLSVIISLDNNSEEEIIAEHKIEQIAEVHKWATMLLLRHTSSNLNDALSSFIRSSDRYYATILRDEIIKLSNREESFFIKKLKEITEEKEENLDPDLRNINIIIDDNFRKQQLVNGIEIPQRYTLQLKLSEITNSQREKMTEMYFESTKTIPKRLGLYLPTYNIGPKKINTRGKEWQAKLNPSSTEAKDFLDSWEKDYQKSYEQALKESEKTIEETPVVNS